MASNYNLRNNHAIGPPEPTIPCLEPACNRRFYNRTGRSNHIRSKHPQFMLDPQHWQQADAPITSNSVPSQAPSSPSSSAVSSNSRSQSRGTRSGDEGIDNLDDNFNMDIAFDGGYEGGSDDQHSSGNQTRESSAARSNNWAHEPHVPVIPRINRTHHPIINGQFRVLTVIHIYFILRNNL